MAARPFVFKLSWLETGTDTPIYGFNARVYWPRDIPMKLLYLLRHAKSSWDDPDLDDFDRPLNKRGRKSARAMAAYFKQTVIQPDSILCSPAKRTRETLKYLTPVLGPALAHLDRRVYEASYQTLLHCLAELPPEAGSVLLVGHNPGLERLALYLMSDRDHGPGAARLQDKYPTGSLAVLTAPAEAWGDLKVGSCRLDDFVRPIDLDADAETEADA
jgi:phosphohistidine phosphatase